MNGNDFASKAARAAEWIVDYRSLHQAVDYSPYDGMTLTGAPVLTISRGEIVAENQEPKMKRGRGRFLERQPKENK